MGRKELISPEGLRQDGRRANELRFVNAKTSILPNMDGSAYFELGNTKVLAAVYGPTECRIKSHAKHDRAIVNVEYTQASFSRLVRRKQRKFDRKNMDLAIQIRDTFESVIQLSEYPRSEIDIYLTVMQGDGSESAASINATTLALINAGIEMQDYVVATTVGTYEGVPLLDVNNDETGMNIPSLTLAVLPRTGHVVYMQCEHRIHQDRVQPALDLAEQGCLQMHTLLNNAVQLELQYLCSRLLTDD